MNSCVSVIVPAYNAEKHIERCIYSIINQTYKNIDVILVNDGSTDNTLEICKSFTKDSRITIIDQKNFGVSMARNAALDIAKGEYYTFVDADDYLEKDFILELYSKIFETNADIVECGYIVEDETTEIISRNFSKVKVTKGSINITNEFLKNRGLSDYLWHKIFKRELFVGIRFLPFACSEDFELLVRMLNSVEKIDTVNKLLYHYVRSPSSAGNSSFSLKKKDVLYARIKVFEDYISSEKKIFAAMTAVQILSRIIELYKEIENEKYLDFEQTQTELQNLFAFYYGPALRASDSILKYGFRLIKFTTFRISPKMAIKIFK